jgi:hypothetical protein
VNWSPMKLDELASRFRIDKPEKFRLADYPCDDTCGLDIDKSEAKELLAEGIKRMSDLQERLYAQDCWAVLGISRRWMLPARTARSST